jgi:hypothetical protein
MQMHAQNVLNLLMDSGSDLSRWLPGSTNRSRAVSLLMPSGMVPNCSVSHASQLTCTSAGCRFGSAACLQSAAFELLTAKTAAAVAPEWSHEICCRVHKAAGKSTGCNSEVPLESQGWLGPAWNDTNRSTHRSIESHASNDVVACSSASCNLRCRIVGKHPALKALACCVLSLTSGSAKPRKQSRSFGSFASRSFRSAILSGGCKSYTV